MPMAKRRRTTTASTVVSDAVRQGVRYAARRGGEYITNRLSGYNRRRPVSSPPSYSSRYTSTVRSRTRRRGMARRYHTIGKGPYRVKRPRTSQVRSIYQTHGSVWKGETGDVVTDNNCVLVGHSTVACDSVGKSVFRAIVRMGMEKARFPIQSFEKPNGFIHEIRFFDSLSSDTLSLISAPAGGTYQNVAELLYAAMLNAMATTVNDIKWYSYVVKSGSTQLCILFLQDVMMDLRFESNLIVQNRTVANLTGDAQTTNAENVANNPLVGRFYTGTGNSVIFKSRDDDVTKDDVIGTNLFGEFARAGSTLPISGRMPLSDDDFSGYLKSRRVYLQPGELKKNFLVTHYKMDFQQVMLKMYQVFKQLGSNYLAQPNTVTTFGRRAFFMFEKCLNSRVDEPSISVGYEVNMTVMSSCYQRHHVIPPLLDIA